MVTHARLCEVLDYNPDTGLFTWKIRPTGSNETVGTVNSKGYLAIKIDQRLYRAHRLAWFYVHGTWPTGQIDHWDLNKLNNALSNLRDASNSQNQANKPIQSNNTSGVKGVYWHKQAGKWAACVKHNGKKHSCGLHDSLESAAEAVASKRDELFGDFSRN